MSLTQRDVFLTELLKYAREDKSIMVLSADMGAPSLDVWREELPKQVLQMGISEANTINFGAGLANRGYKVYVYTMGVWAARCFEQMRYSCAMAGNPITFLATGVAFGYAPSGPAHESTEDIAYMRSLCGVEILSPVNTNMVKAIVDLTVKDPKFRYVRLERSYDKTLDILYPNVKSTDINEGMEPILLGTSTCIVSSGYMMDRALKVATLLKERVNLDVGVVDLWKIKPINPETFKVILGNYPKLVTLEEQTLSGGFGSAVCEVSNDQDLTQKILRIGLPEKYTFDNGTREEVLDICELSVENIYKQVLDFCNK